MGTCREALDSDWDAQVSTNSAADAAVSARRAVEGLEHVLTKVCIFLGN